MGKIKLDAVVCLLLLDALVSLNECSFHPPYGRCQHFGTYDKPCSIIEDLICMVLEKSWQRSIRG